MDWEWETKLVQTGYETETGLAHRCRSGPVPSGFLLGGGGGGGVHSPPLGNLLPPLGEFKVPILKQ